MFQGVYTALVTPFHRDESFDEAAFRALIESQVAGGVDGIVPVGTTGESPTLEMDEHKRVIETAIDAAAGRIKVIAGTGGNSTKEALALTRHAKDTGANGTLQVTPYYNKPSDAGLTHHFSEIADVGLPVILYNIPGRTGLALSYNLLAELAAHPNIVAVKEAGGDVDRVSHLVRRCDLEILSGDDMLTLPMMAVGGIGVISVASNIIPTEVSEMVQSALAGNWSRAMELHGKHHELFCNLFLETNPLPVKTALSLMGRMEAVFRSPLASMREDTLAILRGSLEGHGLL
jgi:4-hydroxy-tetrahydrodipicolinate synthase